MNIGILQGKLIDLCQHLIDQKILFAPFDINGKDYFSLIDYLLDELKKSYPETKFKRIMRSVHYANGFKDENLKEYAFKLDEVEQVLSFNKFIDHDMSVEFFNEQIVKKEVNQYTLTETMIESLINGEQVDFSKEASYAVR